jgi:hypothetical protein
MECAAYIDGVDEGIAEMEKLQGHKASVEGIVDKMKSTKTKTSAVKHNKKVVPFSNAIKKK